MGLFNKIKNILFEADEEETEEMPVYTKEEKAVVREEPVVHEVPKIEEDLINTSGSSYFSNIKRDIDYSYDEVDVLAEVPGSRLSVNSTYEEPVAVQQEMLPKEEKKSPFLTFDEDEFERLNSRINKNENRIKKEKENSVSNNIEVARRTNSNFSATSTSNSNDRTNFGTSKKFTPSLVISPVYGVLNKNYTKEDIVDKKDGMKREIVKPIVRKEIIKEEPIEMPQRSRSNKVDIDSVRKKAFGDEIKKEVFKENDVINVKEKDIIIEDANDDMVEEELDFPKTVDIVNSIEDISDELVIDNKAEEEITDNLVEEMLDEDFDNNLEEELPFIKNEEQIEVIEEDKNKPKIDKSKILDDLEKTSTLQILDDIERELNSIKPITEDYIDEVEEKDKIERNDTLENDLFNLIDSMYEEGEEEEND